jgi:hypothetical protein
MSKIGDIPRYEVTEDDLVHFGERLIEWLTVTDDAGNQTDNYLYDEFWQKDGLLEEDIDYFINLYPKFYKIMKHAEEIARTKIEGFSLAGVINPGRANKLLSKPKRMVLREEKLAIDRVNLIKKRRGRELKVKTPGEFLEKAYDYFKWCDENPWYKKEAIKGGDKVGTIIEIPTQRPYTVEGMCVFIGITRKTFTELYSVRKDFIPVTTHAREVIEANQLEGAIVGAYNPNIIARKLGLADKKEISADNTITWVETSTYDTEQETDNSKG